MFRVEEFSAWFGGRNGAYACQCDVLGEVSTAVQGGVMRKDMSG